MSTARELKTDIELGLANEVNVLLSCVGVKSSLASIEVNDEETVAVVIPYESLEPLRTILEKEIIGN